LSIIFFESYESPPKGINCCVPNPIVANVCVFCVFLLCVLFVDLLDYSLGYKFSASILEVSSPTIIEVGWIKTISQSAKLSWKLRELNSQTLWCSRKILVQEHYKNPSYYENLKKQAQIVLCASNFNFWTILLKINYWNLGLGVERLFGRALA
jgi:hypothetical protein